MKDVEELPASESVYNEDGVDLSLIRWMLALTPLQRLMVAQGFAQSLQRVRYGRATAQIPENLERPLVSRA